MCTTGNVSTLLTTGVQDDNGSLSVHNLGDSLSICYLISQESGMSGLFTASITNGRDISTPALLDDGTLDVNSARLPFRGHCSVLGNELIWASIIPSGIRSYDVSMNATDRHTPLFSGLSSPIPQDTLPNLGVGVVGTETWAVYDGYANMLDPIVRLQRLVVDANGVGTTGALELPLGFSSVVQITSLELWPGMGGAWIFMQLSTGQSRLAWLDEAGRVNTWRDEPPGVAAYFAAYPVAVNGSDLAMAYNLDGTTWRIYWLRPDTSAPVVAGPSVVMAPDVVRPGGYLDRTDLLLLGAQGTTDVTAWSTPWGSTAAQLQQFANATKLSTVTARRLYLARVSGHLQAVWTERIPGNNIGGTEYVALFTAALNEAPM